MTAPDQLVYICGAGHSGSTLLDMLLGGHPEVTALGEIHRLYLSAHKTTRPHRCDCGRTLVDCPFWNRVGSELAARLGEPDRGAAIFRERITTDPAHLEVGDDGVLLHEPTEKNPLPVDAAKLLLVLGHRGLWRAGARLFPDARVQRTAAVNSLDVFAAVRAAADTPLVVDSTKNPARLKALWLESTVPMRLVYVVRDGRAVTHSRMRRQGLSMEQCARIWVAEHRKQRVAQATIPGRNVYRLRYEDLCREPAATLTALLDWLGLAYEPAMLDFRNNERHGIGGNPMRFKQGDATIRLDERWREGLGAEDLATFEAIAGKTNRGFGYDPI